MDTLTIEEKALRILAKSNNLIFTFKLMQQANTISNESYELYIEAPTEQGQIVRYRMITTQNKETRPFKDLDNGKKFIHKISPNTTSFSVVIGETGKKQSIHIKENRKNHDRRKN